MSDEPKKRSRRWLWWGAAIIAAAIIAVYVLSIGPAWRWALSADSLIETGQRLRTLHTAYAPVYWIKYRFELPCHVIDWYTSKWWDPPPPWIFRCTVTPVRR
jgi:hypothetical protein